MANQIILPFKDKEGNTCELTIDLDRLSKNGILDAIRGIGRTGKKTQRSTFANNDLSRLPEILDTMDLTGKKNWWFMFAGNKKTQSMPSPQDGREMPINLEEGHDFYNTKSSRRARGSNPFVPPLNEVELSAIESEVLDSFIRAVEKAGNVSELSKILDQILEAGIRINAYRDGQQSFANFVVLKILSDQFEGDKGKDIIRKLLLNGASISYDLVQDKRISEVYNKLYQEVQPQLDKRLKELKEVGESAVRGGTVEDVGIDNKTFYMKFSRDSTVEPAKVLEGTRRLGLNTGWIELGGHIMRMGNDKIWRPIVIWKMLRNPAYKGLFAFGKSKRVEKRGKITICRTNEENWICIPVPKIVDEELFNKVQKQLNKQRARVQ